jgi:hypothetical protein
VGTCAPRQLQQCCALKPVRSHGDHGNEEKNQPSIRRANQGP